MEEALSDFETAIEQEKFDEALDHADGLLDDIDTQLDSHERLRFLASTVLQNNDASQQERRQAKTLLEKVNEAEQAIVKTTTRIDEIATGNADKQIALETVENQRTAKRDVDSESENLRNTDAVQNLGPMLHCSTGSSVEIPLGTTETKDVTVSNSGGTAASDVSVSVDSPLGIEESSPLSLGNLPANEDVVKTLTISADAPSRRYTVDIAVSSSGDAEASAKLDVYLLDEYRYLHSVEGSLEEISTFVQENSENLQYYEFLSDRVSYATDDIQSILADADEANNDTSDEYEAARNNLEHMESAMSSEPDIPTTVKKNMLEEVDAALGTLTIAEEADICYLSRARLELQQLRGILTPIAETDDIVSMIDSQRETISELGIQYATNFSDAYGTYRGITMSLTDMEQRARADSNVTGETLDTVESMLSDTRSYLERANSRYA